MELRIVEAKTKCVSFTFDECGKLPVTTTLGASHPSFLSHEPAPVRFH